MRGTGACVFLGEMGVQVLVAESERGAAAGIARMLGRLRIEAVVAASADDARAMLGPARTWRGFLVDPKVASRRGGHDTEEAGLRLLSEIAASKTHRFAPRAAISRVASARLVGAVAKLGVAAGLSATEIATLCAYLAGPHESVAERLELGESTVATHVVRGPSPCGSPPENAMRIRRIEPGAKLIGQCGRDVSSTSQTQTIRAPEARHDELRRALLAQPPRGASLIQWQSSRGVTARSGRSARGSLAWRAPSALQAWPPSLTRWSCRR